MDKFNTQELLLLPKGIALTRAERLEMCRIIESAVKRIYGVETFYKGIIEVDGVGVNYEYMSKAVNNRLLLRKLVYDERGDLVTGIGDKDSLFAFVKANLNDLFHPRGKFFRPVYSLLEAASRKGDAGEESAFAFVEEMARKKGMQIKVLRPRTVEEDVYGGVDGFFTYNDRNFTIQVKPLSENVQPNVQEYSRDSSMFIAFCSGMVREIKTDYLVLYDARVRTCRMFRSKGVSPMRSQLLIPKSNEVLPGESGGDVK